jgi:hypothetical protein
MEAPESHLQMIMVVENELDGLARGVARVP